MNAAELLASRWPSLYASGVVTLQPDKPVERTIRKRYKTRKDKLPDDERKRRRTASHSAWKAKNRHKMNGWWKAWRLSRLDYARAYQRAYMFAKNHNLPWKWNSKLQINEAIA